jgi:hypothetical protein
MKWNAPLQSLVKILGNTKKLIWINDMIVAITRDAGHQGIALSFPFLISNSRNNENFAVDVTNGNSYSG